MKTLALKYIQNIVHMHPHTTFCVPMLNSSAAIARIHKQSNTQMDTQTHGSDSITSTANVGGNKIYFLPHY